MKTLNQRANDYMRAIIKGLFRLSGLWMQIIQGYIIQRDTRDHCWCGGNLESFKRKPAYGICQSCGTYVCRVPPKLLEMAKLYSYDFYWQKRQKSKGSPVIEARPDNDNNDGRIAYWLDLINTYAHNKSKVIEVGCGSGALLEKLKLRGFQCTGLEPDNETASRVQHRTGIEIRTGFFPNVAMPICDLFLAFDVVEHSQEPVVFIKGISDILVSGGIAIIQTPMNITGDNSLFESHIIDAVFDDVEHLFIFSDKSIEKLIEFSGMKVLVNGLRWRVAHEIVIFQKTS